MDANDKIIKDENRATLAVRLWERASDGVDAVLIKYKSTPHKIMAVMQHNPIRIHQVIKKRLSLVLLGQSTSSQIQLVASVGGTRRIIAMMQTQVKINIAWIATCIFLPRTVEALLSTRHHCSVSKK